MSAFACGGLRVRGDEQALRLAGAEANVTVRLGIPAEVARRIPAAVLDGLEIAAYAFAAESRDEPRLSLRVPVRAAARLSTRRFGRVFERVTTLLGVPTFLELHAARRPLGPTALLGDGDPTLTAIPADAPVDVVLFSSGLDSLVGALDTLARGGFVVLLHHRTSPRLDPRVAALAAEVVARGRPGQVAFVPLWVAGETRTRDARLRALLFAAAAGALASAFGEGSAVRFFENGVVSLGLPLSAVGLGQRPSRSTHPQVLACFSEQLGALTGRVVPVDNAFLFLTKGEVGARLAAHGAAALLARTTSCTRERKGRHCGACASCVDRRFAVLAAGLEREDPAENYAVDLLSGARPTAAARAVATAYVRAAMLTNDEDEASFFARHGELARVLHALPEDTGRVAARLHDLHQRHAREVEQVLDDGLRRHAAALRRGTLPASSLLVLALPESYRTAVPSRPRRPRGPAVRVLHVSDFHFSPRRTWDQDPVLAGLVARVESFAREGLGPHLVLVTGDVADRGAPGEYALAERFFTERLLPAARLPTTRLFFVPGNHDVDRGVVGEVALAAQESLLGKESQDALATVLGNPRERGVLLQRHDAYLDFVAKVRGEPRAELPWWSERLEIEGVRVHLAGLCSSWMACGDTDKGRLLVARYQLHQVFAGAEDAELSISLAHHPWDYLADFDAHEVREAVQRRCSIALRGHLHSVDAATRVRPHDAHVELAAGAAYGGSRHPHGFSLIECWPRDGVVRLRPCVWDGHAFILDRNVLGGSADGVLTLPMPVRAKSPGQH